jgi:hypothetical protein
MENLPVQSNNPVTTQEHTDTSTGNLVLDTTSMGSIIEFSKFMSSGKSTLPVHLQGSTSDCMAIVIQAMQWNMNPFAVAQKTHLVSGTLGYEAQLVNAVISSSRAIEGRFHYKYNGDWDGAKPDVKRCVIVGAKLRGEDEIQWGEPLFPAKVTTKNSPLWKTAEKQQASYLAVKYWARMFCPAVMLGVYTTDELQDSQPMERTVNQVPEQRGAISRPTEKVIDQEQEISNDIEIKALAETYIEKITAEVELTELVKIGKEASQALPEGSERTNIGAVYNLRLKELQNIEQEKQRSLEADKEDN